MANGLGKSKKNKPIIKMTKRIFLDSLYEHDQIAIDMLDSVKPRSLYSRAGIIRNMISFGYLLNSEQDGEGNDG